MVVFAIDPSLSCTGWAFLEVDAKGVVGLTNCGTADADVAAADADACERAEGIALDLAGQLDKMLKGRADPSLSEKCPLHVIIETPMEFTNGLKSPRSAATAPNYGIAVGVIWQYFRGLERSGKYWPMHVRKVSASTWAIKSRVKGDTHKQMRVKAVEQKFKLEPGTLGPKSTAGNVADAVMLGLWEISACGSPLARGKR